VEVDNIYHDFLNACKQPGCPICHLEKIAEENFYNDLLKNYLKKTSTNQSLRESRGLCHKHSWRLLASHFDDAQTLSLIYHDLLITAINDLQSERRSLQTKQKIISFLHRLNLKPDIWLAGKNSIIKSHKQCPACEQCERAAHVALSAWKEFFEDDSKRNNLASINYLCLPHLNMAYEIMKDSTAYQILLNTSKLRLEILRHKLVDYLSENEIQTNKNDINKEIKSTWTESLSVTKGEE
jgi:hypothetical protein